MKTKTFFTTLAALLLAAAPMRAQIVADGATNTLSNVTNTFTGDVTIGTNGSFTLLVLSDNALLTNSAKGVIGQNATARTNEVRLLSPTARWHMGDVLYLGSNGSFNRLVISNGAAVRDFLGFIALNASSSNNTALVTGSGSTWSNLADVWVGANGAGNQLVVSNGGTVLTGGSGLVGANGRSNVAVVTGSASLWSNASDLQVGNSSAGNQLLVSDGGTVRNGAVGYVGVNTIASNNLAVISGVGSVWSNALDLNIGLASQGNQLIVSNGATVFAAGNGLIGQITNANGNSVLLTDSGTRWSVGSSLFVGSNGALNSLVVSNGAFLEDNGAVLGSVITSSSNSARVTGGGSLWTNRGDLTVGNSGRDSQLIVSNGGWVASRFGYVSLLKGSSNSLVVVSGNGSVWTNQFDLEFAYKDHSNRMVIEAGGVVSCNNGRIASGGDLVFGTVPINNEVLVTGPGSLWTNRSAVEVNNALVGGFSQLVVSNGAAVISGGAGAVGGTANKLIITGAGSRWANQADFTFGGSANQLEVSDGAAVVCSNATIGSFFSGGDDTVLITGTGTFWTNRGDLTMGLSSGVRGVLVASNGASAFTGGRAALGINAGANLNSISVTDPGTSWIVGSDVLVGSNGSLNRLVVSNGAMMQVGGAAVMGINSGANLNASLVTGPGTRWIVGGSLLVGSNGAFGLLVVSNGAVLSSAFSLVGQNAGANSNLVTVTGSGSVWTNNGLNVGEYGSANRVVVTNGGRMESFSTILGGNGTNNEAVVAGSGSLWNESFSFYVGFGGPTNRLVVSDGGELRTKNGYIGYLDSGNLALVTGPGSVWTNTGSLTLGYSGSGNSLMVSNASLASISTNLIVGDNPPSTNNRVMVDGGTLRVANAGRTGTLDVRRGTNILNTGLIDVDQLLLTNSLGAFIFNGGTLITRGAVINNGLPFSVGTSGGTPALWNASLSNHFVSNYLMVGSNSSFNQLIVTNGAFMTNSSITYVGVQSLANSNTMTVTGPGSEFNGYIVIGDLSRYNRLIVTNGAVVRGSQFFLGPQSGSGHNEMIVTGAGSKWLTTSASSQNQIGGNGNDNRLTISDGGFVSAATTLLSEFFTATNNEVLVTGTGSTLTNAAELYVGLLGPSSRLTVSNGGFVVSSNSILGHHDGFCSNNVAVVTGAGSVWTNYYHTIIGATGSVNLLIVTNGGRLLDCIGHLGAGASSSNNIAIVTGPGSLWNSRCVLYLGENGRSNKLTVSNGGSVQTVDFVDGFFGDDTQTTVTDAGSLLSASINLFAGQFGDNCRLVVSNGARVQCGTGSIGFGQLGTNNSMLVTGAGSTWINTNNMFVGGSRALLVVTNGGSVVAGGTVLMGSSAGGNRIGVDGGALVVSNPTNTAVLDLENGTNVLNSGLMDVDFLFMTNAQGFFEFNGGTLITRGAFISAGFAQFMVGTSGTTPAVWDVRASTTNHVLTRQLIIGNNASFNQLLVTNGALFTNSTSAILGSLAAARSNSATIAGAGSRWSLGAGVFVGGFGSGNRLVLSNSAELASTSGAIGQQTLSSNNTAAITGPGSLWTMTGDLSVGLLGRDNTLFVSDGGQVANQTGFIGNSFATASNNLAVVTGAGSFWSNAIDLQIGNIGAANQLIVSNNAVVSAGNSVYLGLDPASARNRLTVDGGTLRVTNAGVSGLLEIRRGTNVFNTGLIEADIVRMTNSPQSVLQFNGGTLSAKSSKISSGTTLKIGNGTSPATMLLVGNGLHDWAGNLIVQVTSNAVVTGNGTVSGGITFQNGSTLLPGTSIGKITFNNSPAFQGSVVMEISKSGVTLTNDKVQGISGTLTYGGTLTVSNIGLTALAAGDRFQLFPAPAYTGAFSAISLPPLGPKLTWKTNLLVDGSIEVAGPPAIPISSLSLGSGAARVYTQDFNSLENSGGTPVWENNVTLVGWYAAKTAPPFDITSYRVSNGTDNMEGLYSFGFFTGPFTNDRALGSIAENPSGHIAYGLCFSNDTANTVSNVTITYTGEQWRDSGSANSNTLSFWYRVSPTVLTSPEPGIVTNWTEVTNLDFVSPTVSNHPSGLDGNNPANRHAFSAITIPGLVVPPGQHIFFRWHDSNDSGADQGMALDDLVISLAPLQPRITSIVRDPTNSFVQLIGQGESNLIYGIEAASNLNSPVSWQRIGSNTANSAGIFQFTDSNAPPFSVRFYRALFP